ncbi:acetyl-CoA acetyltransferase [Glycocaulis alkaliphilus]|uniref:Acetyl-CoA acetyltransferase n=1 Tax=Glycocaulis alkaliphilus TaxID=1434191 RepID=A0A3T0E8P3_9PROT|nr:acetyl-CoA acetyltransferase [Glycocaulis alkaliphilus]AZU03775.1 acetyl-CoA acetyltransferase [Glycocaulis alkaliphilus]GGB83834.1 acetyl-CoA acetyltransferase [Glycocaulis alkaliphilus]
MTAPVFILGGAQSDFAANWTRKDKTLFDMVADTTRAALDDVQMDAAEIDAVHVGNFAGELFCGQGLLGGFMGHVDPGFEGKPTSRHEAACASGSMAILAAMSDILAGHYDTIAVVGVEMMRNVPGETAAQHLGSAAWAGREALGARYLWPAMFSDLAEEYDRRYGLKYEHLAAISKINFDNAKRNPHAQTRAWQFGEGSFARDDEANPVIEGWMRRSDCGQVTDGSAVIVLAGETSARAYAAKRGLELAAIPRLKGWGHTTAPLLMETKLEKSRKEGGYALPWTRKAITDAYARAGISGPEDVDGIETHDCFSVTEYMAIEHFGLTAPGEAWKAVEDGTIAFDGKLPVNPSGGLIGLGHPVGATGVRMALDAARQTSGKAGDMQVEGAKTFATFNVGGSGTANVSFVIGV